MAGRGVCRETYVISLSQCEESDLQRDKAVHQPGYLQ